MSGDLHFKPAYELAAMIRRRELKPSELMAATIERIEATNPKINAFVALRSDQAMAEARTLDDKIARKEEVGPLAGLPLGVKDLEDVAGLPTTHGSVPFKNLIPTEDSVQVARLKRAGAIVIGKTNAPEFGYTAFTKNVLFGPTRNPWNLERTPGGSSGGSSAAIAGGVVRSRPAPTAAVRYESRHATSDASGSSRHSAASRIILPSECSSGTTPR
jgi:Asp-tRNA(Asn)/Glu-tRNA(Gln) amidotransferase A subunit family amidase